jgi:hypothetical protein
VTEEPRREATEYHAPGGRTLLLVIAGCFGLAVVIGIGSNRTFLVCAVLATTVVGYMTLLGTAYEAALLQDGTLVFRGILRTWQTTVDGVRRISVGRGGGEGGPTAWFKIRFDHGATRIGFSSGKALVNAILRANPAIEVQGYERSP